MPRYTRWLVLALASVPAACDGDPLGEAGGGAVLFLTMQERPQAVMEALYQGRVTVDPAGCVRLDGPDDATVVWPFRFRLDGDGGELIVRDDTGREVGRIGGHFRLGGGEVQTLHEGIALRPGDRIRALERCPGRYWIVGDIPR